MRPRVAGRTVGLTVALAAAFVAPVATTTAASADTASDRSAAPASDRTLRASSEVTLVTGDVVRLETYTDGTERTYLARPSKVSSGYHQYTSNGDSYFVPGGAELLVARGQLDRELFNISGLVRQGYDDAHRDALPLIVTYPKSTLAAPQLAGRAAPQGSRKSAVLPAVNGMSVAASKKSTATFWADVAPKATVADPTLSDGIGKIWLDSQVRASLDQSVPMIGAPETWGRGHDGKGVQVAVLDTGIDPEHPDFAGRIGATQDFSGKGNVVDGAGHGTHVASTIAGSGAASDGRYKGVAPNATLMVGKVLDDEGQGSMSGVMEGMEWAASHGADIVNLSLGGPATGGDDPLSQTVNRLSTQYGTLFVIAAGNHGPFEPGNNFVSSPGAADSALTVGSVNKRGFMAGDSRRGRIGDSAIKPELVAPGVSITAARASGTGSGDDPYYMSMSGTSMATPHVAGAAALLKQVHPDWSFTALKNALTSTTTPVEGATIVRAGAGLVNVDRATSQQVVVDQGALDMGYLARPFTPEAMKVEKTVTYRNDSTASVTLNLTTTLTDQNFEPGVDGALSVTPSTLTLAPGATGSATVRLDATDLSPSQWTGRVVAVEGKLQVSTAVGFYKQDDTTDLTFKAIDRRGNPAQATMRLAPYKEKDFTGRYFPDFFYIQGGEDKQVVRVPDGDYNLWAMVLTPDESGRFIEELSIVGVPRVQAGPPNQTIVLDARKATPVSLKTQRDTMIRSFAMSWYRGTPDGGPYSSYDSMGVNASDGSDQKISVAGTDKVDDAPFYVTSAFDAAPPIITAKYNNTSIGASWQGGPAIDGMNIRMALDDAGSATPEELDGRYFTGRAVLVRETPGIDLFSQVRAVTERGARVVLVYSSQPGVFWPGVPGTRTVLSLPKAQGDALHAQLAKGKPVSLTFDGQPNAPYAYDVSFTESGAVPKQLSYSVKDKDLAKVPANLHTTGTREKGWRMHDFLNTRCDCDTSLIVDIVPSAGRTRTEYVNAQPDTKVLSLWEYLYDMPGDYLYPRDWVTYPQGKVTNEDWMKAPFSSGPSNAVFRPFGENSTSQRFGDTLFYTIAAWTDSAGHWTSNLASTQPKSRLYRDGELVSSSDFGLWGDVQVPTEAAEYRLETEVDHDGSLFGLSNHISSAWTFRSAGNGGNQVLPLLDVDYTDVRNTKTGKSALDLTNTAAGSTPVELVLNTGHQPGATAAPATRMTVSVSYDDGKTWAPATVTSTGTDAFKAAYTHAKADRSTGFVSLKISAADGDGNTMEQTIIRAYHLK